MDYPKHADTFELYYYLGEERTLKKVALLKYAQEATGVTPGSPEWESKFASFYTKIKRWSSAEEWDEWVKRKEIDERGKREEEVREQSKGLVEMVKLYRKMVRFALSDLGKRLKDGEVKIRTLTEAKTVMELDLYLTKVLQQQPQFLPSMMERVLGEADRRKVDSIFEGLHKRALSEIDISVKEGAEVPTPEELGKLLLPGKSEVEDDEEVVLTPEMVGEVDDDE